MSADSRLTFSECIEQLKQYAVSVEDLGNHERSVGITKSVQFLEDYCEITGWHPMSEKPPKGDGVYQATLLHKNTGKRGVDRAFYLNGKWPEFMFSTQIGWMELPEPASFVIEEQSGE